MPVNDHRVRLRVTAGAIGGQRLLELLEKSHPDLAQRAIVITADTMNYETHRFLQGLKCPYHEKPFLISDLLQSLELVLDRSAGTAER